jgi:hypothetical protein
MTWGQLRMQLQVGAAGLSLDLLDEFLNTRYEQVLESNDWKGARYHSTVQTQAAYQSTADTVTFTVGNSAVTGVGTPWTSAVTGQRIYRPGDSVIYTATYVSNLLLTLDRAYEGNGTNAPGTMYSASPYVLMQNVYSLPSDVRSVITILDPVTETPLNEMTKDELDLTAGPRTLVQNPVYWAPYDDTTETSPPVVHQIELFPPPLYARGLLVEYLHAALGFDGGNTGASPLPWVSATILLKGCRADIQNQLANECANVGDAGGAAAHQRLAGMYAAEFGAELERILRLEHWQKRKKMPMRMAARFTRHRMIRATRGLNRNWGPSQGGPT